MEVGSVASQSFSIHGTQGRRPLAASAMPPGAKEVAAAQEVETAFSQFVGATVFGQMLKSMRQTVSEPAYFHGGRAEEVFRGQLDQVIADKMTEGDGATLAKGMFRQQFPEAAGILSRHEASLNQKGLVSLDQLSQLRRR